MRVQKSKARSDDRYQKRVPRHLHEYFGATVWKRSFRTDDRIKRALLRAEWDAEAARLIADAEAAIQAGFKTLAETNAPRPLSDDEFREAIVDHFKACLTSALEAARLHPVRSEDEARRRLADLYRPVMSGQDIASARAHYERDLGAAVGRFPPAPGWTSGRMVAAIVGRGAHFDASDPRIQDHWRAFALHGASVVEIKERLANGEAVTSADVATFITSVRASLDAPGATVPSLPVEPAAVVQAPSPAAMKPADDRMTYSKLYAELVANKLASGAWTSKTKMEHEAYSSLFVRAIGDKKITDYTKADARRFKAILMGLPANWSKLTQLRDLSPAEAAERARELGIEAQSAKNTNKIIGYVGSLWTWAVRDYDEVQTNPFSGLKLAIARRAKDERDPFSDAQLKAIFNATIYTGYESERRWRNAGPLVERTTAKFWIPLIALFSGARLGEIVQLHKRDVRQEDGVWFFDITDDGEENRTDDNGKNVKTTAGHRRIPVHSQLIELGFLDFVQSKRKTASDRIFDDVERGEDGYWSTVFSKYFNAHFLPLCGAKTDRTVFHSFRHNFERAAKQAGLTHSIMATLQGHVETGMAGRYGGGENEIGLDVLKSAMDKITYRNLDLSHLIGAKK